MLMWNILYVTSVIGKCICSTSWSNCELTTALTIILYYSCCYCNYYYYYYYYKQHQNILLLLLLLQILLIKKATTEFLELKYLVSEVCCSKF